MPVKTRSFGDHLRDWRGRRRMSQLDLALEADVSQRHIAFLESGRAKASRDMVLRLAETLEVPLRERNGLLHAAGFAPAYAETSLDAEGMAQIRAAIDRLLAQHMPFPAMLFDRYWTLLDANPAARTLFGVSAADGPVNIVMLLAQTPEIKAAFENWPEIAHHMMTRLKLELDMSGGDPKLAELIETLRADPVFEMPVPADISGEPLVYTRMRAGEQVISMFSTIAQFGTPRDITLGDLRIELFFPGDAQSEAFLRAIP